MKTVPQKYLHISGIQKGDCWRACLASILECDIELFPDPNKIHNWVTLYTTTLGILHKLGYDYTSYSIAGLIEDKLKTTDCNGYVIAIGKSPRSKGKRISHAVVWKNGIVYDPHPDQTGLLDLTRFEILTRLNTPEP